MANLPTVSETLVTSEQPRSAVSGADIAAPYKILGDALDQLSGGVDEVAVQLARQHAQSAVTIDENGNPRLEKMPLLVGRAADEYQRVAYQNYAAQLAPKIAEDAAKARTEFEGNPAGFQNWAKKYKEALVGNQPNPELGNYASAAVARTIGETYDGLLIRQHNRDVQAARTAISARQATLESDLLALFSQGDRDSPGAQSRLEEWKRLNQDRVANPIYGYPRQQAEYDQAEFLSRLEATGASRAVVDTYVKDGAEAARQHLQAISEDPRLNASPAQRLRVVSAATESLNKRIQADDLANRKLDTEVRNLTDVAVAGYQPPPERIAEIKSAVVATGNPIQFDRFNRTAENLDTIRAWQQLSPAQLEGELGRLDVKYRENPSQDTLQLRAAGGQLLDNMRKAIHDDPLNWAQRVGIAQIAPIDFGGQFGPADLRGRIATAEVVAKTLGTAPVYLTTEERNALAVAASAGGSTLTTLAKQVADGAGDRSGAVLAEISKNSPTLAHVGGLLSGGLFGGGSQTFANDVAEGLALQKNPEFKPPSWLSKDSGKIATAQAQHAADTYGGAFMLIDNNRSAAVQSAKDAFFARSNRNNYDPLLSEPKDKQAFSKALQESAGATFDAKGNRYGGVQDYSTGFWGRNAKVLVPGNIRADKFRDLIGSLTDDDLKLLPVSPEASAAKIKSALPVAVPGGYRFAVGDPASDNPGWVRGSNGQPFVLNHDALEEKFRARVPGAYIGAR